MASENVIQATFDGFYKIHTKPSWLIDHGMELSISGIDLPDEFECHFSNSRSVAAKRQIGENGVVTIPDEYFLSNAAQIFCWIYLHPTVDSGVTEYEIVIPLLTRPNVDPAEPTQEQQDIVDQAIAALNVAMAETSADAESASASATAAQAAVDSVLNMTVSADTLPSGSDASVTKSVVDDAVHLAFGIPQGAQGVQGEQGVQGPTGATPNFTIGTVQTLPPTQDATATITGTAEAPVLNLGIPKGYSGDATNLAADYSSNKIYAVGEYCIYNGSLYRCITAITTAEAWTSAHWTAAVLGDDVGDLKNNLDGVIETSPNLFWFTNQSDREGSGVSLVFESPDTVTINGTATSNILLYLLGETSRYGTALKAGTYYVKFEILSGSISGGSVSYRWGSSQTTWAVGVHTSETDASIMVRIASGLTAENCKLRFWIVESDEPVDYIPYLWTSAVDKISRKEIERINDTVGMLGNNDAFAPLKIYAHRGDISNAPGNSLLSYAAAQRNGFYGVETDTRQTSDGVLIMNHDADVTDVNGNTYTISSTPWSILKDLTVVSEGKQYKLSTLEDALRFLKMCGLHILLEIKQTQAEIASQAAQEVIDAKMDEVTTFNIGGYASRLNGILQHLGEGKLNIETAYNADAPDSYRQYLEYDDVTITFGVGYETFVNETITIEELRSLEEEGFKFYFVASTTTELNYLLQYFPDRIETKINGLIPNDVIYNYALTLD